MRREYALLAYFDKQTEQKLKQYWTELFELGITDYGLAVKDRRPHITLADYQELAIEEIVPLLVHYFSQQQQVPIRFHSLGTFVGQNMLYLAPNVTKSLLDLHGSYHEQFKMFDQNPKSYYLPNHWVPHCTIAGRLTDLTMPKAFDYFQKNITPFETNISEVGLVEVYFNEEGNIVKDRVIFSMALQTIL